MTAIILCTSVIQFIGASHSLLSGYCLSSPLRYLSQWVQLIYGAHLVSSGTVCTLLAWICNKAPRLFFFFLIFLPHVNTTHRNKQAVQWIQQRATQRYKHGWRPGWGRRRSGQCWGGTSTQWETFILKILSVRMSDQIHFKWNQITMSEYFL